jgi:hypothetical protein
MAQSTFKAIHTVTIGRIATSYNGADVFRDGAIILGNTKTADRNVVDTFDLLAPDDGLPLEATATIVRRCRWRDPCRSGSATSPTAGRSRRWR